MDFRLRCAVDANVAWHEDLCALHGVGSALTDGLWSALTRPPPLHADAVSVEPAVSADQVIAALAGREHCAFKDSFSTIDGTAAGFDLLFSASWIHCPAGTALPGSRWAVVTDTSDLADWTQQHGTSDVLLPGLLERAHFKILAFREDDRIVAGAVARLGSGTVDVSNVWATPGHQVEWAELAGAVHTQFPGRALVGYEHGADLEAAIAGGFSAVGELRVWVR